MAQAEVVGEVCKETLAADVKVALLELKVEASVVEAAASKLLAGFKHVYGVSGKLVSELLLMHLHLETGGTSHTRKFKGDCGGGFCGVGEHALHGVLQTDDLTTLYACTSRFQFNATANYFNVKFFDNNWKVLGHAHCCPIPDATGVRHGKGSWTCA